MRGLFDSNTDLKKALTIYIIIKKIIIPTVEDLKKYIEQENLTKIRVLVSLADQLSKKE